MTLRLYLDEDTMRHSLVRALRSRNVDVLTALEAGMDAREDDAHLDYATAHGRVLCTFNAGDFYRLHSEYSSQGRRHAGIILIKQQSYTVGELLRRLLRLTACKSPDEMVNGIEFLSAWG